MKLPQYQGSTRVAAVDCAPHARYRTARLRAVLRQKYADTQHDFAEKKELVRARCKDTPLKLLLQLASLNRRVTELMEELRLSRDAAMVRRRARHARLLRRSERAFTDSAACRLPRRCIRTPSRAKSPSTSVRSCLQHRLARCAHCAQAASRS
jgi:hypothetical protein